MFYETYQFDGIESSMISLRESSYEPQNLSLKYLYMNSASINFKSWNLNLKSFAKVHCLANCVRALISLVHLLVVISRWVWWTWAASILGWWDMTTFHQNTRASRIGLDSSEAK